MAMGKRKSEQGPMWIAATELPVSPGHPFYVRLNEILDAAGFDRFCGGALPAVLRCGIGSSGVLWHRLFRGSEGGSSGIPGGRCLRRADYVRGRRPPGRGPPPPRAHVAYALGPASSGIVKLSPPDAYYGRSGMIAPRSSNRAAR